MVTCSRCDLRAEVYTPYNLCRAHAIEFYTGMVAVAAATHRMYLACPDMVPSPLPARDPRAGQLPAGVRFTAPRLVQIPCRSCSNSFEARSDSKRTLCPDCRSAVAKRIARTRKDRRGGTPPVHRAADFKKRQASRTADTVRKLA